MSVLSVDLADIKAEALVVGLLWQGLRPDQILFKPLGAFHRRAGRDIEKIQQTEIGNYKGLVLELNRDGIYDGLPEQLFHLQLTPTPTLEEKIKEIHNQREKEQKSRLFFLPLEQELSLLKVWIEQIEQSSTGIEQAEEFVFFLRRFWDIPDFVSAAWLTKLIPVLPYISEFAGDTSKTAALLSDLVNEQVYIKKGKPATFSTPEETKINTSILGFDWTLPGEIISYIPSEDVCILVSDPGNISQFLPHSEMMTQLEWIAGLVFPAESVVNFNVALSAATPFILDETGHSGVLGYSSFLDHSYL